MDASKGLATQTDGPEQHEASKAPLTKDAFGSRQESGLASTQVRQPEDQLKPVRPLLKLSSQTDFAERQSR